MNWRIGRVRVTGVVIKDRSPKGRFSGGAISFKMDVAIQRIKPAVQ
ncbi:DUF3010 family protein [Marinobacter confluentis]|uniref:DUF3010 family protein n=1 Tax=Marinobacter confluentis TaxID=1697557 RepID=A0A4Z1BRP1_9GAMM|nr:DUF3010 family protein [Marinobacter confluentis]TGN40315.1 DUF3010 family protein [Marinobacter confluentis]